MNQKKAFQHAFMDDYELSLEILDCDTLDEFEKSESYKYAMRDYFLRRVPNGLYNKYFDDSFTDDYRAEGDIQKPFGHDDLFTLKEVGKNPVLYKEIYPGGIDTYEINVHAFDPDKRYAYSTYYGDVYEIVFPSAEEMEKIEKIRIDSQLEFATKAEKEYHRYRAERAAEEAAYAEAPDELGMLDKIERLDAKDKDLVEALVNKLHSA